MQIQSVYRFECSKYFNDLKMPFALFLRNKTQQKMSKKSDILILLPYINWNNGSIWNHLEVGCETERPKKHRTIFRWLVASFYLLPN